MLFFSHFNDHRKEMMQQKKSFVMSVFSLFLDTQKKLTIFLKQRGETSISSQKRHFGSLSKNLLRKPGENYYSEKNE